MTFIKHLAFLVSFITLWSSQSIAQALDAPNLTCVSVNAIGSVNISWEIPNDPLGEFTSYEIFYSNDNLSFNLIAAINNYNTTNFIHNGANAQNGSVCYYMVTKSFNGATLTSNQSEKLCTIYLEVAQSNPAGFAELQWESWTTPPTSAIEYQVEMEFPAGIWNQIASLPLTEDSYNHEVSSCGEFLNFRVNQSNSYGCVNRSNIVGDFFDDTTAPEIPTVISVDVDSTSYQAIIEWTPAQAGDTDGYIIYQCLNGFTLILDTIWGQNNTSYQNLTSTAGSVGPEGYTVASFDTCLVGTPPTPNTSPTSSSCQTSMFLTASWFPCQDDVNLNWTPYLGWEFGVAYYEVYAKENGLAPQLLGIVDGNDTQFTHIGINLGSSYTYFVKAFASINPFDAISSTFVLNVTIYQEPAYVYLASASVVQKDLVEIQLRMDSVPEPFYYILERRDAPDEDWETQFTQVANNVNYLQFFDYTAKTSEQSYEYRIQVDDACGDSITTSNIGKTIFLRGLANSSTFINTLTWSEYEVWDAGISDHTIYRTVDGYEEDNPVGISQGSVLYFEDDVYELLLTPGEFCYTVEATENTNFLGFNATSLSNEVCVTQQPKIWIPNAFIINGVNNIFRPVISFADFSNYRMIIYNRWGDPIFETQDILEGWDGTVNGKIVQEGQYMYYISVADGFGGFNERRGAVIMLVSKD